MKKVILSMFLLLFLNFFISCAGKFYTPTIVTQHNYGSFDISFAWDYHNNVLNLTGLNNFWTEIFDVQITLTPVNANMEPVGKSISKYIGSLERNKKFNIKFRFNEKSIKFIKIDYYYTYSGYNSSGSRLNFYTIYLKI